jgi:hypothetical protein
MKAERLKCVASTPARPSLSTKATRSGVRRYASQAGANHVAARNRFRVAILIAEDTEVADQKRQLGHPEVRPQPGDQVRQFSHVGARQ